MAIFSDDLIVLHDDNTVFVDKTADLHTYARDAYVVALNSAEDRLYLGLYKPFDTAYVELAVANTNANTFTAEYWNGSAFVSLVEFQDDTVGFTRSGFMKWKRAQTDWATTTINGELLYFVRFRPSVTHSVTTSIQGINLVFANDIDMSIEFHKVNDLLGNSRISFILLHEASRNEIIQRLRNDGHVKYGFSLSSVENITKWDMLDLGEINQAAKYLALAKLFFEVSDNPDDKWYQRYKDYSALYNGAFDLYMLAIDLDDDGVNDPGDTQIISSVRLTRRNP